MAQVLTEARVGHDSLARVRGLDTQAMEPHEGELLVGWALSRHAKEQLPAAEYLVWAAWSCATWLYADRRAVVARDPPRAEGACGAGRGSQGGTATCRPQH